jgi:hypothetical protein
MNALILHETKRGLFINLPVPVHAVSYVIIESDTEIITIWAMKAPGDESVATFAESAKRRFPDLDWVYVPDVESMGYLSGSPNEFESYKLIKDGNKLILDAEGGGTIGAAFSDVTTAVPHRASPVDDMAALAAFYSLVQPGTDAEQAGLAEGLSDE